MAMILCLEIAGTLPLPEIWCLRPNTDRVRILISPPLRIGAVAARLAHNQEAVGASPTSASKHHQ